MKWSVITGLGVGSLAMAGLALVLAATAVPLSIQLEDPTAIVSKACEKGQVAQCAKDREHARARAALMLNGAGLAMMGSLVLGGLGTLSLAKMRREEQEQGPKGPLLLGPRWSEPEDEPEPEPERDYHDLFRK